MKLCLKIRPNVKRVAVQLRQIYCTFMTHSFQLSVFWLPSITIVARRICRLISFHNAAISLRWKWTTSVHRPAASGRHEPEINNIRCPYRMRTRHPMRCRDWKCCRRGRSGYFDDHAAVRNEDETLSIAAGVMRNKTDKAPCSASRLC